MSNPRQKPATLKDIANRLGISVQTVSLAVNRTGRISQTMRDKILAAARELNYRPNTAARALAGHGGNLFGVALPFGAEEKSALVFSGIADAMRNSGCAILAADSSCEGDAAMRELENLRKNGAAGLIVCSLPEAGAASGAFSDCGIAVFSLAEELSDAEADGAERAAARLLKHAPSAIAMLTHGEKTTASCARLNGFRRALENCSCDAYECEYDGGMEEAEATAAELLEEAPEITAVFCDTAAGACGVRNAARKLGIAVPEKLEIIGFGGSDNAAEAGISTVELDPRAVGRLAGIAMRKQILQQELEAAPMPEPQFFPRATTRND